MFYLIRKIASVLGEIVVWTTAAGGVVYLLERGHYAKKNSDAAGRKEGSRRRIAVITGASSGLGADFARQIASDAKKYGVDKIWLIARRGERLTKLAGELDIETRVIPMDVTDRSAVEQLADGIDDAYESVALLINAAGMGKSGSSEKLGYETEKRMIDLDVDAAVSVTQAILPHMSAGSRIMEICSVAGFQPIPFLNTYAASKAFLYSYSRALRVELLPKGISVTAVSPYWVYDTEFIEGAAGKSAKPPLSSKSQNVVRRALRATYQNRALSTPGFVATLDRIMSGLIPDELMSFITSTQRMDR